MNLVTFILLINLILVVVVLALFIKLGRVGKGKPLYTCWKLIIGGVIIFLIEEVFTILRLTGLFDTPRVLNGILEMMILTLFIYVVLFQRAAILKVVKQDSQNSRVH